MVILQDDLRVMLVNQYMSSQGQYVDYTGKYLNAQLLLMDKPEKLKQLDELKVSLELLWGYNISTLQAYRYTSRNGVINLKNFVRPVVDGEKLRVTLFDIKTVLDQFKFNMDKIVITSFGKGGIDFTRPVDDSYGRTK